MFMTSTVQYKNSVTVHGIVLAQGTQFLDEIVQSRVRRSFPGIFRLLN